MNHKLAKLNGEQVLEVLTKKYPFTPSEDIPSTKEKGILKKFIVDLMRITPSSQSEVLYHLEEEYEARISKTPENVIGQRKST